MPTIMMGKMEMVLPDIHIINKFIGSCLIGANAMSQDFYEIIRTIVKC